MIKHGLPTSFPRDFINSISSGLKLAMDIDFTLCGGVKPRLKQNYPVLHFLLHMFKLNNCTTL